MNINAKLLHTASLYTMSAQLNLFAERTLSLSKTINCLISGSNSRIHTDSQPQGTMLSIDYKVIADPAETVNLGDQLRDAKDAKDTTIFEKGEIVKITPIIHKSGGVKILELDIVNVRE